MLRIDHKKLHYLILAGILIVAIIGAVISQDQTPTGMTSMGTQLHWTEQPTTQYLESPSGVLARPEKAPTQAHKVEAIDYVHYFFGNNVFIFPNHPCARAINEQLSALKSLQSGRIETFGGGMPRNQYRTILFEGEKQIGKVLLVEGFDDPGKGKVKLLFSVSKAIVSINSWQDTMTLDVELHGVNHGEQTVFDSGRLRVASFECQFGY